MKGPVQLQIENKLRTRFPEATHIEVINESWQHSVPAGSESHFKIIVVAEEFQNMKRLQRHREVQAVIAHELENVIRAAAVHPLLRSEWEERKKVEPSPGCRGGSLQG